MGVRSARFESRLKRLPLLLIDTAPMIYHLEDIDPWSELTRLTLDRIAAGELRGLISTVSVGELLVKPFQLSNHEAAWACEEFLLGMPNTEIVAPDYAIARAAARLRADTNLRMPDALICATALEHQAAILTNDESFDRIDIAGVEVILLSRFVR